MFPNIFPDAWCSSSIICFIYTHTHTNLCLMYRCHVCAKTRQRFGVIKSGIVGHKFLRFQRKANVSLHCNLAHETGRWNVCVDGTERNVSRPNVPTSNLCMHVRKYLTMEKKKIHMMCSCFNVALVWIFAHWAKA